MTPKEAVFKAARKRRRITKWPTRAVGHFQNRNRDTEASWLFDFQLDGFPKGKRGKCRALSEHLKNRREPLARPKLEILEKPSHREDSLISEATGTKRGLHSAWRVAGDQRNTLFDRWRLAGFVHNDCLRFASRLERLPRSPHLSQWGTTTKTSRGESPADALAISEPPDSRRFPSRATSSSGRSALPLRTAFAGSRWHRRP